MGNTPCLCGSECYYTTESMTHSVQGKWIVSHNVPHHKCDDCDEVVFDLDTKFIPMIRYAFDNNLREIDYLEWDNFK
ncbi:YgiT-type zinc finger protein [Halobacillus litoralis]|uniref:YgiT-type zinc finger protein n=1 Tax=Halobacillus litoralis TaxID=45668 RepID=UPI001CD6EA9F|nr:YgiT-type zinc finger protein [Halobacillus litoralis]